MNHLTLSQTRLRQLLVCLCAAALLLLAVAAPVAAQSTDQEAPTPIGSNEIGGQITARDVGDARLTRYFYAFTGTPGDLVVTVESKNLNGDVDIFVAGSLRPVAKISMYAGELSASTSKSVYLRQRESLILRVEARTPNDDPGSYRIRFGGAFEPLPVSATAEPQIETPTVTARTDRNTKRVTSTGARINEPVPETPTTEPATREPEQPVATSTPEPSATPNEPAEPSTAMTETANPTPPRTARSTRRGTRRGRGRPAPQRTARTPTTTQPETAPAQPETGPRLIIETRDGMRVERFMSTVRRVTVENGQIVVITKDGKIERQPMTNVIRMAIEQ
jgi:hypothetical protein